MGSPCLAVASRIDGGETGVGVTKVYLTHPAINEPITVGVTPIAGGDGALRVRIGDVCLDVSAERESPSAGCLRIGGTVVPYYATASDNAVQVWIAGRVYTFGVTSGAGRIAPGAASAGLVADLTAPMPGTILEVRAAAGDSVAANQPLIVMESMKMEMTLSAAGPGKVEEILCAVGELVEMGALLARLKGAEGDAEVA